jgi:polar amino acid transport system substrate-binding protein
MIRFALAAMLALFVFTGVASAQDALIVYYHQRPPYSVQQADGSVQGILADIVSKAMTVSGIAYKWERLPSARQMAMIKRNQTPGCGLGWFKRPDREAFAKFTAAIYRDLPTIVVARSDDARFAGMPSLDALFADKTLTLLTKTGYSYGAEIDTKIGAAKPNARADASDNRIMLGMVSRARVDYMIMAEEEAQDMLSKPDLAEAKLAIYHLADPPAGENRYLMCSQSVSDEVIARFNTAITPPQP